MCSGHNKLEFILSFWQASNSQICCKKATGLLFVDRGSVAFYYYVVLPYLFSSSFNGIATYFKVLWQN